MINDAFWDTKTTQDPFTKESMIKARERLARKIKVIKIGNEMRVNKHA